MYYSVPVHVKLNVHTCTCIIMLLCRFVCSPSLMVWTQSQYKLRPTAVVVLFSPYRTTLLVRANIHYIYIHACMYMYILCTCIIINVPVTAQSFSNESYLYMYMYIYMIKRDNIQSNTIQHSNTRDKLFFPKKNELPQVGFEPTTLCSLEPDTLFSRPTRQLRWQGSNLQIQNNTRQSKASQQPVLYRISILSTCIKVHTLEFTDVYFNFYCSVTFTCACYCTCTVHASVYTYMYIHVQYMYM